MTLFYGSKANIWQDSIHSQTEERLLFVHGLALNVVILLELLSVASDVNGRVFPLVRWPWKKVDFHPQKVDFLKTRWNSF